MSALTSLSSQDNNTVHQGVTYLSQIIVLTTGSPVDHKKMLPRIVGEKRKKGRD